MGTGTTHEREVCIGREDRNGVRESVRCDEQVEGLDGGTSSPEEEPELSRLLPQVRRLRQLMATVQQGKYPPAVGSRAETASELGDHRPADRHLLGLEEPVDDVR